MSEFLSLLIYIDVYIFEIQAFLSYGITKKNIYHASTVNVSV